MSQYQRSRLFLVRLWTEQAGESQTECRGKVQDMVKGEAYYFNDWRTLVERMLEMSSSAKDRRERSGESSDLPEED